MYEWEPRIWDPQAASDTIKPIFHSPAGSLPSWLSWVDGVKLAGLPEGPTNPFPVTAIADVSVIGWDVFGLHWPNVGYG